MISTIEVTPTSEVPTPRAKARPTRITKAEMRSRMAKVRAGKNKTTSGFECSQCKRTFENQHGLTVHTARPGRFHAKRVAKVTRGASSSKSTDLMNLQTRWMTLAAQSRGAVREALMECVIDLRLVLRG